MSYICNIKRNLKKQPIVAKQGKTEEKKVTSVCSSFWQCQVVFAHLQLEMYQDKLGIFDFFKYSRNLESLSLDFEENKAFYDARILAKKTDSFHGLLVLLKKILVLRSIFDRLGILKKLGKHTQFEDFPGSI